MLGDHGIFPAKNLKDVSMARGWSLILMVYELICLNSPFIILISLIQPAGYAFMSISPIQRCQSYSTDLCHLALWCSFLGRWSQLSLYNYIRCSKDSVEESLSPKAPLVSCSGLLSSPMISLYSCPGVQSIAETQNENRFSLASLD